jgi:putative DNA-invertase from lambdoid prophage Rac
MFGMSQTILYARVSTTDQTIPHQETQARAAGFEIDEVIADHGVSGVATKLGERPEGKRLFDILRKGDTLLIRWIDRLGRQGDDVVDVVRAFMKKGVVVRTIIGNFVFDGSLTDPVQKAVRNAILEFMAAQGEAQAEATKQAQRAGIAHARANEGAAKYRGRQPSYTRRDLATVDGMLAAGATVTAVAEATGLSRQAIYRIRDTRAEVQAALAKWESV